MDDFDDAIVYLPLANSPEICLVNYSKYKRLKESKWFLLKSGYVVRYFGKAIIYLHRRVLNLFDKTLDGDHINRIKLDNTDKNLRVVTHQQNIQRKSIQSNNTSKVTGLHFYKAYQKWQAYINVNGKRYNLGYFENKEDGILAINNARKKYHNGQISL